MKKKRLGRTFLQGLCMGVADVVPGISGGTVAFLMGFYEELMRAIKSISLASILALLTLRFKKAFEMTSWDYLVILGLGAFTATALFSRVFVYFFSDPVSASYLCATFFGMIVASSLFLARQHFIFGWKTACIAILGTLFAWMLTGEPIVEMTSFVNQASFDVRFFQPKIIITGMAAISVMLMPGISGSYFLVMCGMYVPIVTAVSLFVENLPSITKGPFLLLCNFQFGIMLGAISFSRLISYCLERFRSETFAFLLGIMFGAMRVLWPFSKSTLIFSEQAYFTFAAIFLGAGLVYFLVKRTGEIG